MYSAVDADINSLVQPFCEEAGRIWYEEAPADSLVTLVALQLLSQAYVGHGKDHYVLIFRNEACRMSQRMSLLGVDASVASTALESMPEDERTASSYAAWGVFNWTVLSLQLLAMVRHRLANEFDAV